MEKQLKPYKETVFPNWTVEEFDNIRENHAFSKQYEQKKHNLIKQHKTANNRYFSLRTAAAIAIICLLLPFFAYATATHFNFFKNAFGNTSRNSIAAHEEQIDNGNGGMVSVIYPKREYVDIDEKTAEALIGDYVCSKPMTIKINDHTLTINSAVRDENAIIMDFNLSCNTGVTALKYDSISNETKGAWAPDEATFVFNIDGAGGNIYIDPKNSTDKNLHGLYYGLFTLFGPLKNGTAPTLWVTNYGTPMSNTYDESKIDESNVKEEKYTIPAEKAVTLTEYTSDSNGYIEISPLSLKVDMDKGLGLSKEDAKDPYHLSTVSIEYKDGTKYQVYDRDGNVDNTSYLCGTGTEVSLVFNRLVDVSKIKTINVNGVSFYAK